MPEVVRRRERTEDVGVVRDATRQRAQRNELSHEDVLVPAHPLELSPRKQERLASHKRPEPVVDPRRDDQIHLAEFVLEQHEDDPVRCRGTLPGHRKACDVDRPAGIDSR